MSGRMYRRRLRTVLVLCLALQLLPAESALAVTKSQVDRACAASASALSEYRQASAAFEEAAQEYSAASLERDNVLYRQGRTAETLDLRRGAMEAAEDRFQQQAVEAHMSGGGTNSALFLAAPSLDRVITTTEFLSAAVTDEHGAAGDLAALQGELVTLQGQLSNLEVELRDVEQQRLDAKNQQESAMQADQADFSRDCL